ncbi:MAG: hypothetical protein CM1200mP41_39660 [Gammaproteobacteria bacterium]|nr:MAG: hypothetical protein CM1200mP41_39660 [Gammaproteobacteria bacterium]
MEPSSLNVGGASASSARTTGDQFLARAMINRQFMQSYSGWYCTAHSVRPGAYSDGLTRVYAFDANTRHLAASE